MKWLPNKALEGIAHKRRRDLVRNGDGDGDGDGDGNGTAPASGSHIRGPSLACGEKEDEKNPFIWECHLHTRRYLQVEIAERKGQIPMCLALYCNPFK